MKKEGSKDESNGALNYQRTIDGKVGFHTVMDVGIRAWGKYIDWMERGGGKRYFS